jgi:hypothetical protein
MMLAVKIDAFVNHLRNLSRRHTGEPRIVSGAGAGKL